MFQTSLLQPTHTDACLSPYLCHTLQAAIVSLGNLLLSTDKEAAFLRSLLKEQNAHVDALKQQLQSATEWLHKGADKLEACRTGEEALRYVVL